MKGGRFMRRLFAAILCFMLCLFCFASCRNANDPAVGGEIDSEIKVICGDKSVVPHEFWASETRYVKGGGRSISCSAVFWGESDEIKNIPSITLNDEISVQYGTNGKLINVRVYDMQYELVELTEYTIDGLKSLPAGEWYVSIYMMWNGIDVEYYTFHKFLINKSHQQEHKDCDHVFKLIIEEKEGVS
jgi:hypothetical protein